MSALVALVGRPNVGKSTLFNRLTGTRDALAWNYPGLTRDRQYGTMQCGKAEYGLVDTGGFSDERSESLPGAIREQIQQALAEAELVILVTDAREGLNPDDEQLARELHRQGKPWLLLVNKIDGLDSELVGAEFAVLGARHRVLVSAAHRIGINVLKSTLAELLATAATADEEQPEQANECCFALIGRPNSGKSTLVNSLLGTRRMVVSEQPGTTRDSVSHLFRRGERQYRLIDTAGVRRRSRVAEPVEKFSALKSLAAVHKCQVAVLVVDASEGITEQDTRLLGNILSAGRAAVIALNKIDLLTPKERDEAFAMAEHQLRFAPFVDRSALSGLKKQGLQQLLKRIELAWQSVISIPETSRINRILQAAVEHRPPPMSGRNQIKLRYAHAGGCLPPTVIIHGSQAGRTPADYQRYLANYFRSELELSGTAVRVIFKTATNPWGGQHNRLSERQQRRRQRLIRYSKKG